MMAEMRPVGLAEALEVVRLVLLANQHELDSLRERLHRHEAYTNALMTDLRYLEHKVAELTGEE